MSNEDNVPERIWIDTADGRRVGHGAYDKPNSFGKSVEYARVHSPTGKELGEACLCGVADHEHGFGPRCIGWIAPTGKVSEGDVPQIDWQQVVLNGGPPCFHVEGPQYCGRAERWAGHGNKAGHDYVSLDALLAAVRKEAADAAFNEAASRISGMSRIEARNCSMDYLAGAEWAQNKAAKLVASLVEGAANGEARGRG